LTDHIGICIEALFGPMNIKRLKFRKTDGGRILLFKHMIDG